MAYAKNQGRWKDCQDAQKGARFVPILLQVAEFPIALRQDRIRCCRENRAQQKENPDGNVEIALERWSSFGTCLGCSTAACHGGFVKPCLELGSLRHNHVWFVVTNV